MNAAPGQIFYEFWTTCIECETDQALGETTRKKAEKTARHMGWRLRRKGWTCRKCVEKVKE